MVWYWEAPIDLRAKVRNSHFKYWNNKVYAVVDPLIGRHLTVYYVYIVVIKYVPYMPLQTRHYTRC